MFSDIFMYVIHMVDMCEYVYVKDERFNVLLCYSKDKNLFLKIFTWSQTISNN